jgi:hypothetical protein
MNRRSRVTCLRPGDVARQVQRLEPGVKIACVIDKPIGLRWRLPGLAHPDQIGSQAPPLHTEIGNNVPPQGLFTTLFALLFAPCPPTRDSRRDAFAMPGTDCLCHEVGGVAHGEVISFGHDHLTSVGK